MEKISENLEEKIKNSKDKCIRCGNASPNIIQLFLFSVLSRERKILKETLNYIKGSMSNTYSNTTLNVKYLITLKVKDILNVNYCNACLKKDKKNVFFKMIVSLIIFIVSWAILIASGQANHTFVNIVIIFVFSFYFLNSLLTYISKKELFVKKYITTLNSHYISVDLSGISLKKYLSDENLYLMTEKDMKNHKKSNSSGCYEITKNDTETFFDHNYKEKAEALKKKSKWDL